MPRINNFQEKITRNRGKRFKLLSTPQLVNDKVKICCLKCGHEEDTTVAKFCRGKVCPCKIHNRKTSFENFEKIGNEIHNYKYDYSGEGYDSLLSHVNIKCPIHGWFKAQAAHHVRKHNATGCKKCSFEEVSRRLTKPFSYFISKTKMKHGDKFNYIEQSYTGMSGDIEFICPKHGKQKQAVSSHLRGYGCSYCGQEKTVESIKRNENSILGELKALRPNFIFPLNIDYENRQQKITIECSNGHQFERTIGAQLSLNYNCPFCSNKINKPMQEIAGIINEATIFNAKPFNNSAQEIDIYYPEHKIGIEYHGLIFHAEGLNSPFQKKHKNYHLDKLILANQNGIKLIQIFEDEWAYKRDIVINKLLYVFNKHKGKRIGARECEVREISNMQASLFLNKYHIQGQDIASINLGSYYGDILVGVMTFKKNKDSWKLNRYSTNFDYIVAGLGSKMLKHFIKIHKPIRIETFADKRCTLSNDNLYTKIGFAKEYDTKPNYFYFLPSERIRHSREKFMKHKILKKFPQYKERGLTEKEMMVDLGHDRIWDCGHYKFVYELISHTA